MEEMVTELNKTWMCEDEKESTPASRDTLSRAQRWLTLAGKALTTALPEFGQRPEREGKEKKREPQLKVGFLTLTLLLFALFFFLLLFHLLPFSSAQMPSI